MLLAFVRITDVPEDEVRAFQDTLVCVISLLFVLSVVEIENTGVSRCGHNYKLIDVKILD